MNYSIRKKYFINIGRNKNLYKKNIALIGLGSWGTNIFNNLCELKAIHTACDLNSKTIHKNKKYHPSINYTASFSAVLKDPDIKAIVIATPASTHYEYARRALLVNKDVFVEKPLALSVMDGEELVKIADSKKKILMVGHILRYHPAIIKLKEFISSGKIGKIQYIYSNRLNIGKFRVEEDILWSFAPHDISVILMLLEDEPMDVKAFGGDYLNKGVYDTTLTTLKFKNGVKSHIFVSWLHPFKEQKLIVIGAKGMIVFDDLSDKKLLLFRHKIRWGNNNIPVARKAECREIICENKEPLKKELKHFLRCILIREKPLTDGIEGVKVLKIIEKAEKSLLKYR